MLFLKVDPIATRFMSSQIWENPWTPKTGTEICVFPTAIFFYFIYKWPNTNTANDITIEA